MISILINGSGLVFVEFEALILFSFTFVQLRKIFLPKIVIIFSPFIINIRCGCSKEPSHCDGSFEYPQHMFWLRNKKISLQFMPSFIEACFDERLIFVSPAKRGRHIGIMTLSAYAMASHYWFPINNF